MADDQEASNEVGEEGDVADYDTNDVNDIVDTNDLTTTTPTPIIDNAENAAVEEYDDDEPLPDVTVNLIINDLPDGETLPPNFVDVAVTDIYGNVISSTPWGDAVHGYTEAISQGIYDELSGNGTDTVGGKRWWGSWTWNKTLFVGLIALCIIGIILALVFLITGKKFKKNKQPTPPGASTVKGTGTKGVTTKPGYSPVPTDV